MLWICFNWLLVGFCLLIATSKNQIINSIEFPLTKFLTPDPCRPHYTMPGWMTLVSQQQAQVLFTHSQTAVINQPRVNCVVKNEREWPCFLALTTLVFSLSAHITVVFCHALSSLVSVLSASVRQKFLLHDFLQLQFITPVARHNIALLQLKLQRIMQCFSPKIFFLLTSNVFEFWIDFFCYGFVTNICN
jgi:hypothetical protein